MTVPPRELVDVSMIVNGTTVSHRVPVRRHLVDFLRENLGLTGSHLGCEHGMCGACTVLVDGEMVRGCLMLAVQADGARVETIEGLTERGALSALQDEFHRRNAAQCGFCTPAMLITAAEIVERDPGATRERIREHIGGNYCRCTGYHAIVEAIFAVCQAAIRQPPRPENEQRETEVSLRNLPSSEHSNIASSRRSSK